MNNTDIINIHRFGISFDVVNTKLEWDFWRENFNNNWEQSTYDFILPLLDKNKVFIDIGAWIGPISLVASKFSKRCICFEPDPIAYQEFFKNIQLNGIGNITLESKAISLKDKINLGAASLGESITRESCEENAIQVECMTVEDLIIQYDIYQDDISVIKIDIEGHEQHLLKSSSILWDLNVAMHISLHPGWSTDKEEYFRDIIPFLMSKGVDVTNLENSGNFFDIKIYKK